ncbi:NAD-dependent deacylase [Paracoccus pacificus]|uniref:NAD-dependent protein deacylase n=1 Tax=Paracoccus pacificus TaxID=1463598 RepID=A0ABW4RCD8_9RHOB
MKIVVLTGAGISAESGLRTFRDGDGLWESHRVEDVATPGAFRRDPALVHRFYNMRRADARAARPNAAHLALADLGRNPAHDLTLVTQNVDDLHERAGSPKVLHMHGALDGALCAACGHRWPAPLRMQATDPCPACNRPATRPDIVWFGEMPHHLDRIIAAIAAADLFCAIGTSGQVYPAAGFAACARDHDVPTLELNLTDSANAPDFSRRLTGPATRLVPDWVASLG